MKKYILTALLLTAMQGFAQKVSDDDVSFDYRRLPTDPSGKGLTNYFSKVMLNYEVENTDKMEAYNKQLAEAEQKYEQEVKDYPNKVKAADEKHKKDMEEWNKKSMGTKIAEKTMLGSNDKPQKENVPQPYKSLPSKPVLKKAYDKEMLASTYLGLDGYTKDPANAIMITVTLLGFQALDPEPKTETKNAISGGQTRTVYYSWYETSYKHPMSVKVEIPGKGEVLNMGIEKFNQYTVAKTSQTEGNSQTMNREPYLQQLEDRCLAENMKYINQMINEKYGYTKLKRTTVLNNVKAKGDLNYSDYQSAYENALAGYNMLASDAAGAKAKIKSAVELWEKAIVEYKPGDKKARVNDDIAISTRINLAEAYLWLDEFTKASR